MCVMHTCMYLCILSGCKAVCKQQELGSDKDYVVYRWEGCFYASLPLILQWPVSNQNLVCSSQSATVVCPGSVPACVHYRLLFSLAKTAVKAVFLCLL